LGLALGLVFFFFSSRRRHTRFSRDWSSDVCSSDLLTCPSRASSRLGVGIAVALVGYRFTPRRGSVVQIGLVAALLKAASIGGNEIGRASCRERGEDAGSAAGVNKDSSKGELDESDR